MLEELFGYFDEECKYGEIRDAAKAMEGVFKMYISQTMSENAFKESIEAILASGGGRMKRVLQKFVG